MIFSKNIVTEAYIGKHKEFSIVEKNMNKLVKEINEYYPKISIDNLNTIKVPISKINDSKYKKNKRYVLSYLLFLFFKMRI